jgi:hypothetical protein
MTNQKNRVSFKTAQGKLKQNTLSVKGLSSDISIRHINACLSSSADFRVAIARTFFSLSSSYITRFSTLNLTATHALMALLSNSPGARPPSRQ